MRIPKAKKADAMIPTASMADIAFLLIIFFMVTTTHDLDRTNVHIPLSQTRTEADKGSAIVVLEKSDQDGALNYYFSNGEDTSHAVTEVNDIYLEAAALIHADKSKQFILKADGTVHFEKIDELLDVMRKGGVVNVLLLTQQKVEGGGS